MGRCHRYPWPSTASFLQRALTIDAAKMGKPTSVKEIMCVKTSGEGWCPARPVACEAIGNECSLPCVQRGANGRKENNGQQDGGDERETQHLAQYAVVYAEIGRCQMAMVHMVRAVYAVGSCRHSLLMHVHQREQQHRHKHCQQHPCKPFPSLLQSVHRCKGSESRRQCKTKTIFVFIVEAPPTFAAQRQRSESRRQCKTKTIFCFHC